MFNKRIRLFTAFGMPVHIDLSWLVLFVLVTWSLAEGLFPAYYPDMALGTLWTMGVIGALGLFAAIIVHELSHSLVARRYDMAVGSVTLFLFGGVAETGQDPPRPGAEFAVAIAGPIASVVIGALAYAAYALGSQLGLGDPVLGILGYLAVINVVLAAFNLLPAFPLDGGRILRSALWRWQGNLRRATRIASRIGAGFGLALILLGVMNILLGAFVGGLWWCLLGLFVRGAAQSSYQHLVVQQTLRGEPIRRIMQDGAISVPPSTTLDAFIDDYVFKHHHKMFPLVTNGSVEGCVTTRHVRDVPRTEWSQRTVGDIAEPRSEHNCVDAKADALDVLKKMRKGGRSRLMVVDDGRLLGVVTTRDLVDFLVLKMELEDEEEAEADIGRLAGVGVGAAGRGDKP